LRFTFQLEICELGFAQLLRKAAAMLPRSRRWNMRGVRHLHAVARGALPE
jgi:hypothetical protein